MRSWLNENAFLLALILVVLAVTPGYFRLESNINDVEGLLIQDQADRLVRCRESNDSRMQIRQTFHDTFAELATLGADPALIERLDAIVPTAEGTDLDCDNNNRLDEGDYSARP